MTWVAGVFDNLLGHPLTPTGIEILGVRELVPSDVLGRTHCPLQCFAVGCQAVAIPSGDGTCQEALHGVAVELVKCGLSASIGLWWTALKNIDENDLVNRMVLQLIARYSNSDEQNLETSLIFEIAVVSCC
jgi:hypothetical protein